MELTHDAFKLNKGEVSVGLDLTDTYSQLSFGPVDGDNIETLSQSAGGDDYMIPTVLFKRQEVNQWYAGKEALKNAGQEGYLLDRLLSRAYESEEITVGEETFKSASLLALFMKRALSMLSISVSLSKIASLMITVDNLDDRMVALLEEAVNLLGLKTKNIFFQSHMESFYYYTIYQPSDLWNHEVLLLDFSTQCLKTFRMECNSNTTPIVAFIDPGNFEDFCPSDIEGLIPDSEEARRMDARLSAIVEGITGARLFSSIYFIGEHFNKDIYKETLKQLARRGRLFGGNNLFSKGAACSAKNKLSKTVFSENYVFLGNEKLKANIGINVSNRGENAYLALMDAGINWFEAEKECEIILNQGNKLSFVITPLTGKNPEVVDITLNDMPKRPPKTTRLHICLKMVSESRIKVSIKDMGFGELFPACNIEWNEVIDL